MMKAYRLDYIRQKLKLSNLEPIRKVLLLWMISMRMRNVALRG